MTDQKMQTPTTTEAEPPRSGGGQKGSPSRPPWATVLATTLVAAVVIALGALLLSQLRQGETERAYRLLASAAARVEQRLDGLAGAFVAQPLGTSRFDSRRFATALGGEGIERSLHQAGGVPRAGICISSDSQQLEIHYDGPSRASGVLWERLRVSRPLRDLFQEVLRDLPVFQHVLITTRTGEVLYRQGGGELRVSSVAREIGAVPEPTDPPARPHSPATSEPAALVAGGQQYLLFLQPLSVRSDGRLAGLSWKEGCTGADLFLAGLVDAGTFHARSISFPRSDLIWVASLLLVVVFSTPILRRFWKRSDEEATYYERWSLCFSAVAVVSLGFLLAWSQLVHGEIEDRYDKEQEQLAEDIATTLERELEQARKGLCELLRLDGDGEDRGSYAAWRTVAWIDGDGNQVAKCVPPTVESDAGTITPFINVAGRRYFEEVKEVKEVECGKAGEKSAELGADGPDEAAEEKEAAKGDDEQTEKNHNPDPWVFESITSWTRGEPQATLSVPWIEAPKFGVSPRCRSNLGNATDNNVRVAALTFRPLSLMDTVLPAGFRFAIIDRDGRVQFHSDEWRNGPENLLAEISDPRELRSVLYPSVASRIKKAQAYDGGRYSLYVKPLDDILPEGTSWSLVVLRNQDFLDIVHLELLGLALFDLLLVLALVAVVSLGLFLIRKAYRHRRTGGAAPQAQAGSEEGSVTGAASEEDTWVPGPSSLVIAAGLAGFGLLLIPMGQRSYCVVTALVFALSISLTLGLWSALKGSAEGQRPTWHEVRLMGLMAALIALLPSMLATWALVESAHSDLSGRVGEYYQDEKDRDRKDRTSRLLATFGEPKMEEWTSFHPSAWFERPLFSASDGTLARQPTVHWAREDLPYFDEHLSPILRRADGQPGASGGQGERAPSTFFGQLNRLGWLLLVVLGLAIYLGGLSLWPTNTPASDKQPQPSNRAWVRAVVIGAPVALLLLVVLTHEGFVRTAALHRGTVFLTLSWTATLATRLWPAVGKGVGGLLMSLKPGKS